MARRNVAHLPITNNPFLRRKTNVAKSILRWYRTNARTLPWRNIRDPYKVLVSEIMLQQTQVSRVLEKFSEFIKRFPSLGALSRARQSSVVRAWRGMGYNNRAIRLRQIARILVKEFRGTIPAGVDALLQLPGVGPYTAHALASFVGKAHVPVVDTNVRRVLARLFPTEAKRMTDWDLAWLTLPRGNAYNWNQALMDFGATVCTFAAPKCISCPLKQSCPSAFKKSEKRKTGAKVEPGKNGIPNRIYRGRIIEILRGLPRNAGLHFSALGQNVLTGYGERDAAWLRRILSALERDGLVMRKKNIVALAD